MARGGILILGFFAIMWAFVAFRFLNPGRALIPTALVGVPQAAMAITLFVKCKCDKKKDNHGA
jgi:hypothetical protein